MIENLLIPEIISNNLSSWLLVVILVLLCVISIKLIISKSLLESVIITSIFSLLIAISYLLMDAPDVAMTEVALGACLSTCVLLSFLGKLVPSQTKDINRSKIISSSIICLFFFTVTALAGANLPEYGDPESPVQTHLTKYYIENAQNEIGVSSYVAALLGSYRGYDTLGETAVILIAGVSVLLLFSYIGNKNA